MQWIINTIVELIHSQLGFFNRGDPAANDFAAVDLVLDGTWRDMDLSAIVPADAQGVVLKCTIRSNVITAIIRFRTKGNVNERSVSYCRVQVAGNYISFDCTVPCDSDRFIQYNATAVGWLSIGICVKSWWLR